MPFDPDKALDAINRHQEANRRQLQSINRLLEQWRALQDWVSDEIQKTDESDREQRMRAGTLSAVLDKMADIRMKDAQNPPSE